MSLLENIKKEQNYTYTENGALALNSTSNALVDLFAISGAMRERSDEEIGLMFSKALIEDKLLAVKLAFYTRDVRGGLGERRSGRVMLKYLAKHYPDIFSKNAGYIAEYGRYDDLVYLLYDAPEVIVPILREQLDRDIENMKNDKPISLLAKWLPSVNTSNKEAVFKGRYLAKHFGMSEKEYRKILSSLRKYLNVVEVNMSAKNYEEIIYPEVPSKAMNNYRNAFRRNDEERFNDYLNRVKEGEEKINASVLYPYDIVEKYLSGIGWFACTNCENEADEVLEEQWKALPDYVNGENNFLIMADVSGSMMGRPLATSVGLALYFAQRNKGAFAGRFMTFSSRPELVEIKGENLLENIRYIIRQDWQMNTDLEAAFDLVLSSAVKYHTPKEELPSSIVVITDMEFDACANREWLFYDQMKAKFEHFGYKIPNIVFWNVNSRNNTYHASFDKAGVQLASGQAAIVFESLVKGIDLTPYEYMLSVLNQKRYEKISV